MEEQLISFEIAKLVKEKGFNIEVKYYYDFKKFGVKPIEFFGKLNANILTRWDDNLKQNISAKYVSAPTQSLLQKWLREKHGIHINVHNYIHIKDGLLYQCFIDSLNILHCKNSNPVARKAQTYEEALEVGLLEALKLL